MASSRPAGTQADGRPRRFAGTTGRIIPSVSLLASGEATSKPTSNGNCDQVGDNTSGYCSHELGDALRLVDLADRWRHLHIAYGGESRLPFPLHELGLLEGAIVGEPE